MSTSSGMAWPMRSQSSGSSLTPTWRATALRWMGALVEPPIAEQTTMAFSKAARVMMSDGFRSSRTISTIRLPVRYAIWPRSLCTAGMAAQPGSIMPSASASEFMVVAVPMVLQKPGDGAEEATISTYSFQSILPADLSFLASHLIVPEPVRRPLYQPLSIGPTESAIAGMFTVAAAISWDGVVLSQPVVSTTPSIG